jgi:hypothetical protein
MQFICDAKALLATHYAVCLISSIIFILYQAKRLCREHTFEMGLWENCIAAYIGIAV